MSFQNGNQIKKEMSEVFQSIPEAFQTADLAVRNVKYAIAFAAALFLILAPVYRTNGSFFGVGSAKRVIFMIRIFTIVELFLLLPLIYCVLSYGAPMQLHALTVYDSKGNSWLYGWGRPILGMVVIGIGVIGDMQIYPRIICILGCCQQIAMDALSEFQVRNYYVEVLDKGAPTGMYTTSMLFLYYWRDLISISLCFLILLEMCYFCCIVGWGLLPYIPYSVINGGELDRCATMRAQRERRRLLEYAEQESTANKRTWVRQTRIADEEVERHRNKKLNVNAFENLQRNFGAGEDVFLDQA